MRRWELTNGTRKHPRTGSVLKDDRVDVQNIEMLHTLSPFLLIVRHNSATRDYDNDNE